MWHHRRKASSAAASSAFAASLAVAILCTAPARAQTYTWMGTSSTDFNDTANYAGGSFTFPTSGTLQLLTGTGPTANLPVLTSSATAGQIRLQVTGSQTGTFNFLTSNPAAVLSLTSGTAFAASGGFAPALVAPNLNLAGAGDQLLEVFGPTTLSGTISGGGVGRFLTVTTANSGLSQPITFSNSANSFDSTVVAAGRANTASSFRVARLNVTTLGMAGSPSSLGTAGKIVLDTWAQVVTATSAVPQTSDKSFELRRNILFTTTGMSSFGINSGFLGGNNSGGAYNTNYPNLPPLTLTGSITTAAWAGSGTASSLLQLGSSGTASGRISNASNHELNIQTFGVRLTNPTNTFSGTFILGGIPGGYSYPVTAFGMAGQPSFLGSGSVIQLNHTNGSAPILDYIGPGETSDKAFAVRTQGEVAASGTGELILSNTTPVRLIPTAVNETAVTLRLSGTGRGRLDSWLNDNNLAFGYLIKAGTGIWTLTGSNSATGSIQIQAGTLLFAKKMSLFAGGTSAWTKTNILMTSAGNATLGVGVGGADGLTNDDVTTLITSLSGDVTSGGMRSTSSWGFDTTNTGSTFTIGDTIANTAGTGGGAIGLAKLGSGTLSLGGANTYTLGTRVDGGVLAITNASALGSGTGFLRFNGGTLDMGGNTVDRGGPMTATAGGLTNGVISGTTSLTKTGGGTFRIDATANTFTGAVAIQEGVLEAAMISGSALASSLGSGTGANATINLGTLATSGTLRFIGTASATTNRVFNLSGTTGGGGIDASGVGALVITSTVTAAVGSKTLMLGGTSTAANEIRSINNPTTGNASVVKDGPGLWRLTGTSGFAGGVTVKNGTIVAGVDTNGGTDAGVFGTSDTVIVGDESSGAAGTASLLLAPGVVSNKLLRVPATTGTQTVVLGGEASGATPRFENQVQLGRDVTLVAATGGTTSFGNTWASTGTAPLSANVSIGSAGRVGAVRLANSLATTGSVAVRFGTLDVLDARTLSAAGIVGIDSGATLAGVGRVAATLGGAGLVAPGNSPGILTADAVDPTGGLDWAFEFSGTAPTYGSGTASVNDVLRLTGTASAPFTTALTSANEIAVYLDVASLAEGNTFSGGFFTNLAGDFRSSIAGAAYSYWVSGTGAGQTTYQSKTYVPLATAYPSLSMDVTTVATTATFSGESQMSGQVTQFTVVVPEPGTLALAALGLGLAGYALRRRRL
jgi:autotransporter-associated beta strand protein